MIADDATLFRDFVKSAVNLVKIDANFIEVTDGKKLFSSYEEHIPEITIIDSRLPNIDVLDFMKKILDIHPIATIIVFVDSADHNFMRESKSIGIEEVLFKTIGQFSLGSIIKKLISKKIAKFPDLEQKSQQNVINALTLTTLDKSGSTSQYLKLANAAIQKRIENIEKLKRLGGDFDTTIKSLYAKNDTGPDSKHIVSKNERTPSRSNFAPQNSPNFFMRELSTEEIDGVLRDKIRQLKETKKELEFVNNRLSDTVSELEESKQELTAHKEHLEEQVKLQAKNLLKSEKLATVGELSARIAHDLRNPLGVIKNTAEMLRFSLSDRLTESEIEQWKRLDRGIYRISHQIDDVLDFIKQRPLQKTKTKISTLLADVLERIVIPDNVEIHLPQNDAKILCDSEKIEVIFLNLILNAVQAMDGRPGTISILIHGDQNMDFVMIEVRDTGPGIPESLGEKVFDPLFTTRQIGTGLGLTSCKRIVEAHEGEITFESIVGVGTRFFIKLPKKTEWDNIQDQTENPQLVNLPY
ncbi:MAG: response regulator [Thaumarchaeota archaeon]|nr:response regulator [Nitrososphaerota archaeon]